MGVERSDRTSTGNGHFANRWKRRISLAVCETHIDGYCLHDTERFYSVAVANATMNNEDLAKYCSCCPIFEPNQ